MTYDVAVIGAGVVGLSFAMQSARQFPGKRVLILEKESGVAQHQTGHNSGVIHSGVYYKPGSLKARLCVAGAQEMVEFCQQHGIPHEVCGKLIVAIDSEEAARLEDLHKRGLTNGLVGLRLLGTDQMREFEPHVGGVRALLVPCTGITDYAQVTAKYVEIAQEHGAELKTNAGVRSFRVANGEVVIETRAGDFVSRYVVNCAGLFSDRIAELAGHTPDLTIIPFRGEYYDLVDSRKSLVRSLIYPTPDPRYPFLGVHFTRRIYGNVDAGPNAVLAFRREGYNWADIDLGDTLGTLTYPGFRKLARSQWKYGLAEFRRSLSKREFVRSCQKLVPEIRMEDMKPGGSGVRAQALGPDGKLVDDFRFVPAGKFLHVLNVPSPAATASLPIGREILKMAEAHW